MHTEILPDADALASRAAAWIAEQARLAVAARGRFAFAVSGGNTPAKMLRKLAGENVPWDRVHVFQIDERVAPAGDTDRNFTQLQESLLSRAPLAPGHVHAMPVEQADLAAGAAQYAQLLQEILGSPAVLDLAHLGIGADGHTASLVPGDPALEVTAADVTLAGPYQGRRRMTLTYPAIDRARAILWLIEGDSKAEMVLRLERGDISLPAGRVCRDRANIMADQGAGRLLAAASRSAAS